jgi:hypothetical protein
VFIIQLGTVIEEGILSTRYVPGIRRISSNDLRSEGVRPFEAPLVLFTQSYSSAFLSKAAHFCI